jgi:hypothetical protein
VRTRLRTALPRTILCRGLGLPRRTRYSQAQPRHARPIRQAIATVAHSLPTSGSRRVAAQMRRAPYRLRVHRQRARRVMRELGRLRRRRPRRRRAPESQHGCRRFPPLVTDRVAHLPDENWGCESTAVRLGAECIDLAISMDVLTRDSRGWQRGQHLGQELPVTALPRGLAPRKPVLHHRDQGLQDAAPQ